MHRKRKIIRTILNDIIDALFPRRCPVCQDIVRGGGYLICEECEDKLEIVKQPYCMKCGKPLHDDGLEFCTQCEEQNFKFIEGRAAFIYNDYMKKSIYGFKYNGRQEYAKYYAKKIYEILGDKVKSWNADVLIPIPLHKSKLKKRGYNQAFLIAKELSNLIKIPVDDKILVRRKKTIVQKNLNAKDRANNVKNAFKIGQNNVKFKSAILIDDIYTTGSTIDSATDALLAGGIEKVYFISLSIGRN